MATALTLRGRQSGRPPGGALMPPWKHYLPAPTPPQQRTCGCSRATKAA